MGVKYKRNTVSCSDCGGGWNEGCYVKLTRSQIKHVVSQIQPTAQSGSNLMVVGLGSGLESLSLAHTQGPAEGKEGDGSLLQGQVRNHQDLDRHLALGHLFHVPSV